MRNWKNMVKSEAISVVCDKNVVVYDKGYQSKKMCVIMISAKAGVYGI